MYLFILNIDVDSIVFMDRCLRVMFQQLLFEKGSHTLLIAEEVFTASMPVSQPAPTRNPPDGAVHSGVW